MLSIKSVLLTENMSVKLTDSLEFAIDTMFNNKQGVVIVVSDNFPVGILTERDVLEIITEDIDFNSLIEDIVSFKSLVTINEKRTIEYGLHVLIDHNIRRLIVVDDFNNFVGVTTQDMLIKHLEDDSFRIELKISSFLQSNKSIITLNFKESITKAFDIMKRELVGSIILLDDTKKPVGILTEKDAVYLANKKYDLNKKVSEVMTSPIITICENENIKDLIHLMDEKCIRRVLVLNYETQEPHSILSMRDIAHNLKGNYGQILESKLKNIKSTLNHIGELVLEVYEDNGEKVIQWMNDTAINKFGNVIDSNLTTLIEQDIWNEVYTKIIENKSEEKYKLNIEDMFFELNCSSHFVNGKETFLLILRDVSKFEYAVMDANKKSAELELELSVLQGVIDQQDNIVFVLNKDEIISANKSFYDFFRVPSINVFIQEYSSVGETFIRHENFFSLNDVTTNWVDDIMLKHKKDRVVSIVDLALFEPKAFTVQINHLSSNKDNVVVTLTDITEIKLESQRYYYHATHDALTGIYNRSFYFDKISSEIEQSKRYGTSFCIILFDIDNFKKFNDSYGHLKGDEVLQILSSLINKNIRTTDTFARWGGEEFIVLLDNITLDKAELIAENFRYLIESMNIEDIPIVTSSFGVTEFKKK